jgi:hypothetical protein
MKINRLEVDVTDDEVATDLVSGKPQDFLTHAGGSFLNGHLPGYQNRIVPPATAPSNRNMTKQDDYAPLLWGKRSAQASRPEARGWKPKGP